MDLPSARNRRLIVVAMLALAAVLFATAIIIDAGNPGSADLPVAIQAVEPESGSNVLSQSDVVVDLAVGYTAELEINGITIPEEQLFRIDALNSLRYEPNPGKIVERLFADQNCVRVTYWLIINGREDSQVYTWCFDAS